MSEAVIEKKDEQKTINVSVLPQDDLKSAIKGHLEDKQEDDKKEEQDIDTEKSEKKEDDTKEKKESVQTDEKIEISKAELEKLQKQVAEKETFIQRQANEVGESRKKIKELEDKKTELETKLEEVWHQGGAEAAKAMKEFNEAETALTNAQVEERMALNKQAVLGIIPDFEAKISDMVEILKQDGTSSENINKFQSNPFQFQPDEIIQLGLRVKTVKTLTEKDAEIKKLQSEIEELKKKPGEILQNIEESANRGTSFSGKSSGSSSQQQTKSVYAMPQDELLKVKRGG